MDWVPYGNGIEYRVVYPPVHTRLNGVMYVRKSADHRVIGGE